jgi:MFS family permease
MEYATLSGLLTPAVIIAALAYLVHLFGKIISDQKPFSDDRDWEIEFSGLFFFLNYIVAPGVVGYVAARYIGPLGAGHWIHFLLVSFLGGWILITTLFLLEKIYQIKLPDASLFKKAKKDPLLQKFLEAMVGLNLLTPPWLLSIVFIYVGVLEYQSGNILWFIFIGATLLFNFMFMASNNTLRTNRPPKVDISLISNMEPMRDLILLKINNDNIRLRDGGKIIILNKAQVLKIDLKIDQAVESLASTIKDNMNTR